MGEPGGPGWWWGTEGRGETRTFLPSASRSCFIDEHVTRVAWLNRSNILYAGNDRWTSDPRVRLLINTPEEFSILITQVGLGDEGLYTCSFQTRHQPYTTQVYLIVHGERGRGGVPSRLCPPGRRAQPCACGFQPSGRDRHTDRGPSAWQLLRQESCRVRGKGALTGRSSSLA